MWNSVWRHCVDLSAVFECHYVCSWHHVAFLLNRVTHIHSGVWLPPRLCLLKKKSDAKGFLTLSSSTVLKNERCYGGDRDRCLQMSLMLSHVELQCVFVLSLISVTVIQIFVNGAVDCRGLCFTLHVFLSSSDHKLIRHGGRHLQEAGEGTCLLSDRCGRGEC